MATFAGSGLGEVIELDDAYDVGVALEQRDIADLEKDICRDPSARVPREARETRLQQMRTHQGQGRLEREAYPSGDDPLDL